MSAPKPLATPDTPGAARQPGRAEGAALLVALYAAVFMVSAEARVIAPLLPAIADDFGISVSRAGTLISLYALPYGLFQLVYGPLADRFSRQRVMGAALGLFALGTLLSGLVPTLWTLDLLRACTGAAAAGVFPVALAYLGDAVPYERRQAALGRLVSMAMLGGVLSAALGGLVASFISWRVLFVVYGVLALLVAAVLLRQPVIRVRAPQARRSGGWLSPYRAVVQRAGPRAWALGALVFVEGMAAMGTQGYLGALLFERDHLSYALIGGLLTVFSLTGVATARVVGRLVARIGERGMLLLGGALMTTSYLLVALPSLLMFPLAMLLGGAGFIIAHSTLQARATELVPELRGTAVALFAFALVVGGAVGTSLAGLGIDTFGYTVTLLATAAVLALFTALSGPLLRVGQPSQNDTAAVSATAAH